MISLVDVRITEGWATGLGVTERLYLHLTSSSDTCYTEMIFISELFNDT